MHALIHGTKARNRVFHLAPKADANGKIWIVDTDLYIRVRRQQQQCPVLGINQHADSDTPLGRTQQLLGRQDTDIVRVLQMKYWTSIDRVACAVSQARPISASSPLSRM